EQIHQVRGTDYIVTELIQITRQFLGRKMSADTVEAWINSIQFKLRDHKAADHILGYSPRDAMFTADQNSPENLRLGRIHLDIGIEPAPVFKVAEHEIRRYLPAVEGLVNEIVSRLTSST
ncbi:MAG: hypothetical protein ABJF28_10620, partial [Nisaea sp.]|uniref:hypothetical protein n=1 Tax=Nisaea sp. TaxID=2024842 RepID=UPI0032663482